jgi:H+-transporting ATPase
LTGESQTLEKAAGDILSAASMIRRGEATGIVIRTGASTEYGRTIRLVRIAQPRLHMEEVVAKLVRRLLGIVGGLLGATLLISVLRGFPLLEMLPLMLVLLLGAIPVALPVMFTVSMAVGARALARKNVLVTRLSAIEDAATMDVLCVDKTGTLTLNELVVSHVEAQPLFSEEDVLLYGALASQQANQDPLDRAFFAEIERRGLPLSSYVQESFVPFNPDSRSTEAEIRDGDKTVRVRKGAVSVIVDECGLSPEALRILDGRIDGFSSLGYKTLAVSILAEAKPALV